MLAVSASRSGRLQRGKRAEDDAADAGRAEREEQRSAIERDVRNPRRAVGRGGDERLQQERGDADAERAARD